MIEKKLQKFQTIPLTSVAHNNERPTRNITEDVHGCYINALNYSVDGEQNQYFSTIYVWEWIKCKAITWYEMLLFCQNSAALVRYRMSDCTECVVWASVCVCVCVCGGVCVFSWLLRHCKSQCPSTWTSKWFTGTDGANNSIKPEDAAYCTSGGTWHWQRIIWMIHTELTVVFLFLCHAHSFGSGHTSKIHTKCF